MRPALFFLVFTATFGACDSGKPITDHTADTDVVAADTDAILEDTDVAGGACDPLGAAGAQGCDVGEKCTWIRVQDSPVAVGVLGCVPDGTVAVGDSCVTGANGETTGFDNCAAGGICIKDACKDVCGFDGSAAAACAADHVCTRYSDLFSNGSDDPVAGACAPTCNPLTQALDAGGTCGEGNGCYVMTSADTSVAVCARAGTAVHGEELPGGPFANACAPGHTPRKIGEGSDTYECGALCLPADVTSTTHLDAEGGVAPYTCESKGASPPDDATNGESCRYYWGLEPFVGVSPFSNTLGFCFKHAVYQYDSNGDHLSDTPFPRCSTLTRGDVIPPISNPAGDDALEFWCVARPVSLTRRTVSPPRAVESRAWADRIGNWR